MTFHDPSKPMWVNALKMLEQADRLQRQFFQLSQNKQGLFWEPPVDIFETEEALMIWVALPGVDPENISVIVDGDLLQIVGERTLPTENSAVIRRMEIPHGRFERRINLKGGHFKIVENVLENGCLKLELKKIL